MRSSGTWNDERYFVNSNNNNNDFFAYILIPRFHWPYIRKLSCSVNVACVRTMNIESAGHGWQPATKSITILCQLTDSLVRFSDTKWFSQRGKLTLHVVTNMSYGCRPHSTHYYQTIFCSAKWTFWNKYKSNNEMDEDREKKRLWWWAWEPGTSGIRKLIVWK